MTAALAVLNPAALVALANCEQRIERALKSFVEIGEALAEIRDSRLYRASHPTFEAYCQERWDIGRDYADRMIVGAQVVLTIVSKGLPAPTKEAQARALAAVPEPERAEVWAAAVERTNGKPTAAAVREVHEERTRPTPAPGPVDAADCPPADPGATSEPVAHPSWPTESELKPWETLAPTADRVAESMEPIADDPRDRTHGAEFESYDVAPQEPDPTPAHYQTSGWTGGDSGSGVACACGMQFDGFASLAEAGELLARHIETPEPDAFTSTAPSGSGLTPAPAADAPVPSQEPAPMAPPRQVQVEEGRKCAETLVEYVRADVLAIIAAVDLGEDLITEQLIADLQAAVDLLASRLEVNA